MQLNMILRLWSHQDSGAIYVEMAKVKNKKLAEFRPLSTRVMNKLGSAMSGLSVIVGGYIPQNLLYFNIAGGNVTLAWITEETRRTLLFKPSTGIKSGKYTIPRLLWLYRGGTLFLHAVKHLHEPIVDTPLFKAPFLNMMSGDNVCMGTASNKMVMDEMEIVKMIKKVEDTFFNSYFSHISSENITGGLLKLYQENNTNFPYENLIDSKYTIGQAIAASSSRYNY